MDRKLKCTAYNERFCESGAVIPLKVPGHEQKYPAERLVSTAAKPPSDRNITKKIKPFLAVRDILLFYGARQVGKTSLMKLVQEKYVDEPAYFFDLEKNHSNQ